MTHTAIDTLRKIKHAIRSGGFARPGGYPMFVVMRDGEALSVAAARAEWCQIVRSTLQDARDGWGAAGVSVNWEDEHLTCAHTGDPIPCAYPQD